MFQENHFGGDDGLFYSRIYENAWEHNQKFSM